MPFLAKRSDNKIRLEHFHSLLWLLKDMCWLQLWPTLGPIILVPTVGLAVFISWKSFSDRFQFFQNLSVMFWLTANAIWMVGELFYDDTTRPYSLIFILMGLVCWVWSCFISYRNKKEEK